ncbi:hypothetical protein D0817_05380 [Flavobacterium cupreum]|uniref:Uncharacterized protein n=1 Tax=Flavobacterium cupreum TaxID=2133766 RepID=A0A434AAB5_9FLAO|nr:hypothetical protein [Flavobacterium cupreum]RUT71308.1 hypothetical protein D0817_05380 [Flavobacterium cupreum]
MIETKDFSNQFLGYNIVDCEVRTKDIFYFIAREDCTQWSDWEDTGSYPSTADLTVRVIANFRSYPKDTQWSHTALEGLDLCCAGISRSPKEQRWCPRKRRKTKWINRENLLIIGGL